MRTEKVFSRLYPWSYYLLYFWVTIAPLLFCCIWQHGGEVCIIFILCFDVRFIIEQATALPRFCCCIIRKSVKVFLCLNPLLWCLPYVRVTVSLSDCYHSIQQCEEVFVLFHSLIQCLDCTLLTILILLRCWSMHQCAEVLGLLHLLLQWQYYVWATVLSILYCCMTYDGQKVLSWT